MLMGDRKPRLGKRERRVGFVGVVRRHNTQAKVREEGKEGGVCGCGRNKHTSQGYIAVCALRGEPITGV